MIGILFLVELFRSDVVLFVSVSYIAFIVVYAVRCCSVLFLFPVTNSAFCAPVHCCYTCVRSFVLFFPNMYLLQFWNVAWVIWNSPVLPLFAFPFGILPLRALLFVCSLPVMRSFGAVFVPRLPPPFTRFTILVFITTFITLFHSHYFIRCSLRCVCFPFCRCVDLFVPVLLLLFSLR